MLSHYLYFYPTTETDVQWVFFVSNHGDFPMVFWCFLSRLPSAAASMSCKVRFKPPKRFSAAPSRCAWAAKLGSWSVERGASRSHGIRKPGRVQRWLLKLRSYKEWEKCPYHIPSTTSLGPWEFIVDPDIWGLICYSFSCSEIFTDQSRPTRGGSVDKGLAWKYFCSCQKTMLIEIFSLDLSTLTSLSGARIWSFSRTRFPEVKLGFWFLMGSSKFWPNIPFLNIHQWTFEMLCGLEFRGPPSPSEQERMRAWKTSQADCAFSVELVLEWSFGESSGSGMKVTCCWRCFIDANAFGEPVQTHPKRSKSKIWGLSAIASHRESLATMISDPDAFPPPDFWMDFGFSWVVACWPDIPFLNIHQWTFETFEMLCFFLSLGVLLVLLNRKGCEHGRPARQTVHSLWNWFWNDLLGNPVGLEWKPHAAGDASLTQMLLGNQFRPIPKGLSLRFGDC